MPSLHVLDLPGAMTERGFWLYVWRVTGPQGDQHLYVGRTGDNSSPYASSVYKRMGQHLGEADNTNALLRHLRAQYPHQAIYDYETFQMVSYGPIFPEVERHEDFQHGIAPHYANAFATHIPVRDRMASLECKLAGELVKCGYDVLNVVSSKAVLVGDDWASARAAFANYFPELAGCD